MRVGPVLEGGDMRGMYTMGVLDAFLDHDVHVDELMGVSAAVQKREIKDDKSDKSCVAPFQTRKGMV